MRPSLLFAFLAPLVLGSNQGGRGFVHAHRHRPWRALRPEPRRAGPARPSLHFGHGRSRSRLGDYFHKRPVLLILDYDRCPNLCGIVLN